MKVVGVIPARLGSTRLAEKVLATIEGRPMIQHVWERAVKARNLDDVIVACDEVRVLECVQSFGGKAMMTRKDHPNGSSRVAEVAQRSDGEIFINIQGDEPTIHPESIDLLADVFLKEDGLEVATLAVRQDTREEYENPNVVKVVCDHEGNALYFSRAPIPHFREGGSETKFFLKHLGIYGYRKGFLLQYVGWEPGLLESFEKLEQLRILERGRKIRVVETPHDSWSVDTSQDLRMVELKIKHA